jgi:phosphate:Na+ symporter
MGANIGTTLTAWLIAILGFKVKMSAIALPLIIAGLFFSLKKNKQLSGLGDFIIGFCLLFIGLEFMKDALTGFENNPALFDFFKRTTNLGFAGILLFVGIGTLLTVVLQSSSAAMAIILVASSQGVLNFEAAAAIVLGGNIGTTITAILAALIAGTDARRTALAHTIFNIIGSVWVLILFYPFLDMVNQFSVMIGIFPFTNPEDVPVGLSIFHSTFNIINTLLLIWFVNLLARLVCFIIPKKVVPEPVTSKPKYLKKNALTYPETSINALLLETKRLYEGAIIEGVAHGLGVHRDDIKSKISSEEIIKFKKDKNLDQEDFIKTRIRPIFSSILKFASKIQEKFQLSQEDNDKVTYLKRINRYAHEIILHSKTLKKEINRYTDQKNKYLEEEYVKIQCALIELLRIFLTAFDDMNPEEKVLKLKELKRAAKNQDAEILKDIDSLIRKKKITSDQGISLITASHSVVHIYRLLIKATRYLMSESIEDIKSEPEAELEQDELIQE